MDDLISRQAVLKLLSAMPPEEAMTKAMLIQSVRQMDSETATGGRDLIERQSAIDAIAKLIISIPTADGKDLMDDVNRIRAEDISVIKRLPSVQPEIIRCKNCKHNPKESWLGCPMSHLSEEQRPETAWCWKGERRTE